ncbi:MAG: PAS domain-containing protein [Proteobacteria bacterium]|nr:PAS domain-containing protein [Pseudomonadota bacterium]
MAAQYRLIDTLSTYWDNLRGARDFPLEGEFDPDQVKDIWPNCFLVQLDNASGIGHFKYTYLGENLIKSFGDHVSEEEARHLVSTSDPKVSEHLAQVVKTGKPLEVDSSFVNSHKVHIKFRTVLLPLGAVSGKVGFVIGGIRWKAF